MDGDLSIRKGASVGVMRYGRIYARVADGVTVKYGDALYLLTDGENAGMFTNAASATTPKAVAVKGRFLGAADLSTKVAAVELFDQAQA